MESRRISLTSSALAHGRLNIRPCGRDFFPEDAFGQPAKSDGMGRPIRLHVVGLPHLVETDLPTDRSGRPRWFFRSRSWTRKFVQQHNLTPGDEVIITRLSRHEYRIRPAFPDQRFIDLFAGIGIRAGDCERFHTALSA